MKYYSKNFELVLIAMLVALNIVLTRVASIDLTPYLRIGFGFLPTAVAGMLLGPVHAMTVAGISDVLGYLIKPTGAYYFGFTLTAILSALVYALFFYQKQITFLRLLLARFIVVVFFSLCLNTLWLQQLQGQVFIALLPPRAIKAAAQFPFDIMLLFGIAGIIKNIPLFHLRKD